MLTLKFKQALVQFVENEHYRDSMTSTGETIENQINKYALPYLLHLLVPRRLSQLRSQDTLHTGFLPYFCQDLG